MIELATPLIVCSSNNQEKLYNNLKTAEIHEKKQTNKLTLLGVELCYEIIFPKIIVKSSMAVNIPLIAH